MWLWAQENFREPGWWWVGLCTCLLCCLAWGGVLALEPTGWVEPVLAATDPSKISASSKSSHRWTLQDLSATSFYDLRQSYGNPPPPPQGLSKTSDFDFSLLYLMLNNIFARAFSSFTRKRRGVGLYFLHLSNFGYCNMGQDTLPFHLKNNDTVK